MSCRAYLGVHLKRALEVWLPLLAVLRQISARVWARERARIRPIALIVVGHNDDRVGDEPETTEQLQRPIHER